MSNDNKYIRLYPERAVAPLRELAKAIAASAREAGSEEEAQEWEDRLEQLETLGFPPDEPLFLLRGQDTLAPPIVRQYAEDAAAEGAHGIGQGEPEGQTAFDDMMDQADAMERWTPRKLPD